MNDGFPIFCITGVAWFLLASLMKTVAHHFWKPWDSWQVVGAVSAGLICVVLAKLMSREKREDDMRQIAYRLAQLEALITRGGIVVTR